MPEEREVRVTDKRRAAMDHAGEPAAEDEPLSPDAERNYLDDLQRLQAEFENYRKRMVREQTAMVQRAGERLVEKLLPVLDHIEAAIAHGEGGKGVQMVHEDLRRVLAEEGVEEIPAEGEVFDPTVHDAFESQEDPDAKEPVVRKVLRRGYRMRDRVIRPAWVVVARPPEPDQDAVEA
jgi:molecular chaperone GrpE